MNHALLFASMAGLGTGPLVARAARARPQMLAFIDGFVLVTIGGLVLLDVIPHALEHRDLWAALFMLVGFSLPNLAERLFRFGVQQTHTAVLLLALVGVAIHSALDGSALAQSGANPSSLIGYGVVLHQLPVSLMVWWVLSDRPRSVTWFVLGLMALTTVVGYLAEPTIFAVLPERAGVWFEAVVGGSLLHVIAHPAHSHSHDHAHDHAHDDAHDDAHGHALTREHAHTHDHAHAHRAPDPVDAEHDDIRLDAETRVPNGIGALLGVALLAVLHVGQSGHDDASLRTVWASFQGLALEIAPALLVAYLMAGLLRAFVAPVVGSVSRLQTALTNGFAELVDQTAPWILVGLILASLFGAPMHDSWIMRLAAPLGVLLFAVAGVLSRLHSARFANTFAAAMIVSAIALGLLVNAVLPAASLPTLSQSSLETTSWLELFAVLMLAALFAASVLRRGVRGFLGELRLSPA